MVLFGQTIPALASDLVTDVSTLETARQPSPARPSGPPSRAVGACIGAMVFVGGSVAVSGVLSGAPMFTAEAVRYAAASLLLVLFARWAPRTAQPAPGATSPSLITARSGRPPLLRPQGTEWLWLAGIAATGLVLFNVGLVQGAHHAEPAVLGVAVACVPPLLAVAGPLLERSRPRPAMVAAALVVTGGAGLIQGLGRTDSIGIAWAAVVFGCEVAFTLLAVPVLGRHGPWGVSVHTTWMATIMFAVIGLVHEGPAAVTRLTGGDWLATAYLAVVVTAVAFVLWYTGVSRLGPGRAGLLTGVAPVAAAVTGVLLGGPAPRPQVWAGITVVVAGQIFGLRWASRRGRKPL
jgi:drug/metabolite transporter (DMT)-like permease